jgi:hypothetical protein
MAPPGRRKGEDGNFAYFLQKVTGEMNNCKSHREYSRDLSPAAPRAGGPNVPFRPGAGNQAWRVARLCRGTLARPPRVALSTAGP